ncbi:MAG: hypothetical protein NWE83_08990 [Candidatus Bathyarchaeota archaeon]|nr:hypothetical protein [Candidatus Bathyarchaeota archaeon]
MLDRGYEAAEFVEIANKPVSAISGVSEDDATLLQKAFHIKTIKDLADNKYIAIAQTTVSLASLVQLLRTMGVS